MTHACTYITVIIFYLGHGKSNTGDWCFHDGFITFRDIVELYSQHFQHRTLTILTDCSHSGAWVNACFDYLDERGVQPCGHSAKEKGVLITVYASCRPEEIAATKSFLVKGLANDKNCGEMIRSGKLSDVQHFCGVPTTMNRCEKSIEESCALQSELTWKRWREGQRVRVVRGKDHGRAAWHYVLLDDDLGKIREFEAKVKEGRVDVACYGQVLKSGYGENPSNEVKDEIDQKYHAVYS